MTVPQWFRAALAEPPERFEIEVEGTPIAYRAWGTPGDPVALLVHGGAAHSGWWDHVGPHLADGHRVLAPDLSGHGDSGRRDEYALETWARELLAVAAAESTAPAVIFGHSMGGFVALTAARDHGAELLGAAAIDSPVRHVSPEVRAWQADRAGAAMPVYPDEATMIGRFRTMPPDDATLPWIRDHIARESIIRTESGWTWKFDPRVFLRSGMSPEDLAHSACEVALIRGERGMATTDITYDIRSRLGGHVPVTVIPDAGHHIMLDQPVALIAALQTLLGQWRKR